MTELAFLLELLLNHKLPRPTKVAVTERIKEVESKLLSPRDVRSEIPAPSQGFIPPHLIGQAPSTVAAMARHPDLAAALEPPQPVAVIAQTPAAQAAVAARQEAINSALSGKVEKGRTSPRKF